MKILLAGDALRTTEMRLKYREEDEVVTTERINEIQHTIEFLNSFDLICDLNFDDSTENDALYFQLEKKPVMVGAVKKSLGEIFLSNKNNVRCHLIGVNTLPTFISRGFFEVCFNTVESKTTFDSLAKEFSWKYKEVKDFVGMVSPRILFMVINEACYSLEEKTAAANDIDQAMKLGTAYPFGPLEWCDKIGVKDVYETLLAIYNKTCDERYKISSLLKTKYQLREKFISASSI